jgi:glycosidase
MERWGGFACLLAGLAWVGSGAAAAGPGADRGSPGQPVLHVPSPDWRDQVLYFVLTDRFADGDRANDDQHAGEFDPADPAKYNGGDLRGLEQHLDYIRGLGATGVWVSPPVLNRWWDARAHHGGYHGYWAKDFSRVDPHFGTLADYRQVSRQLHARGMLLVQDIVLNHTADYFRYEGEWDPVHPDRNFVREKDSAGDFGPTQPPFDRNDARNPRDRAAAIYHWTPEVRDYRDPRQVHDWQMAGLDDLNSENPVVRRALRASYDHWIRDVGVDGFRIDTAFYVPRDALADFLYSNDAQAPGVMRAAAQTGRAAFHVFGEGFAVDKPYEDTQEKRIDTLMRADDGSTLLPGALNFPLYGSLTDVFARGAPSAVLGERIGAMMRLHAHPELMPSFVDNHDVDRFLSGGSEAGLRQGLLLLFTLPGIPTIYYGTEQGFRVPRAAMFGAGSNSGGQDHFDTRAPLYTYIAALAKLRREQRVLSRGRPTVLAQSRAGPGVLAYRMDSEEGAVLVVFNSADAPALLDNLDVGGQPGDMLAPLFSISAPAPSAHLHFATGRLNLVLPARSGYVWSLRGNERIGGPEAPPAMIRITQVPSALVQGDFELSGTARAGDRLQLVADGDLAHAQSIQVDKRGRWRATVDTSGMIDPSIPHRVVAWSASEAEPSAPVEFRVSPHWRTLLEVDDPAGDDTGPGGTYVYPTDPTWANHPLDIRHVRVEGAGGALRISVRMARLSTAWNPPNGFDHVAFNLYLQLPGETDSATAMPMQHAELPAGMRWQRRLRVNGWTNALFSSAGASAEHDGTPLSPAASLQVDAATNTVTFTLPASALGRHPDLAGAKLYLTTWDYDGGYRELAPAPAGMRFGGAPGAAPLWMDDSGVLTLPSR